MHIYLRILFFFLNKTFKIKKVSQIFKKISWVPEDILKFDLFDKIINECFYFRIISDRLYLLTVKRSHYVKGFQLAPKGSPVSATGLR